MFKLSQIRTLQKIKREVAPDLNPPCLLTVHTVQVVMTRAQLGSFKIIDYNDIMKNYKLWNVGDVVEIVHSHSDDLHKTGIIREVRPSFCKIEIEGYPKLRNHTYGQFRKLEDRSINE